jgi:hypothetical protein
VTTRDARKSPVVAQPGETATERAQRLFLWRAQAIPGVVLVEPLRDQTIGEQAYRVYVRDGDLDAEYDVYRVQGEVYDEVPEARLAVELLEESDLPMRGSNAANR